MNFKAIGTLTACLFLVSASRAEAQTAAWIAGDGTWTTDANWDTGTNPNGAGQNATIDTAETDVTVTLDANRTITDLIIGSGDQLTFRNNSDLNAQGSILNNGTILIDAGASFTDLNIPTAAPGVSLSGTGTLRLSGTRSRILGAGLLDNTATHTISGTGSIGVNALSISNAGIIQAESGGLTIDPSPALGTTNTGTLRAIDGGTLTLTGGGGGAFTNTTGTIEALTGSEVLLTGNVSITGGTLSGPGEIRAAISNNVFLTDITNAGTLIGDNNSDLGLTGTINNTGAIQITAGASNTDIEIQAGGATLSGAGTITLSGINAGINGISATRLTNADNTISGQGAIGENSLAVTNQAIITADMEGETLTLDPVSVPTDMEAPFLNEGTLRAENGGTLTLTGSSGGTFTNTTGTIEALADSQVLLTGNASITGGTLTGPGEIRAANSNNVFLTDITNAGTLIGDNNSDLGLTGIINNTGAIQIAASTANTDIEIQAGGATLSGGGTVTLSGTNAGINSLTDARLTNADNTISGQGAVGENILAITNQAIISANLEGVALTLDPVESPADMGASFLNEGTLRAENGGTLIFTGLGGGSFENSDGTIEALADSQVSLTSNVSINGGTLTGPGEIRATISSNVFLTDITNAGTLIGDNNSDLGLTGTINNTGAIQIAAGTANTDIRIQAGGATLSGAGTITLSGINAGINGIFATRLTNADNTISGQGAIGENTLALTNQAIITANLEGQSLTLDALPSADDEGASFLNVGTLRAENGGTLIFTGLGDGIFTNTGGTIEAQVDSEVLLTSGASITGGILTGPGIFRSAISSNVFLSDITNAGTFIAQNNTDLGLAGIINNTGTIQVAATTANTDIQIQTGGATFNGGGTIVLSGANAGINGLSSALLTNGDHTISGRGAIGENAINILNRGTIRADVANAQLTIDDATDGMINEGNLSAEGGGILILSDPLAQNAGTINVDTTSSATVSGIVTHTGGTLDVDGSLVATAYIASAGSITGDGTISAPITVTGPVEITPSGSLEVTDTISLDGAAIFASTVTSPASFDSLQSTGTLTLTNASLQLSFSGTTSSFTATDTITIASSDVGVTGTFSNAPNGSRITTTDGTASFQVDYTESAITLTGIDHAPTFSAIPDFTVPENAPVGTTIGTIEATDEGPVNYSLTTESPFTIDPTSGVITTTGTLDFETQPLFTVTVVASDGALSRETSVTINVTNVLEDNLETVTDFLTRTGGPFEGETDPSIIGFDADPDNDGRSNVFELWLGTDPATLDAPPEEALPNVVNIAGADFGAIEVTVSAELDDVLAIDPEASFDLVTWRIATSTRIVLSESEGRRTLQFNDPTPLPSPNQSFFFRFTADESAPNPSL